MCRVAGIINQKIPVQQIQQMVSQMCFALKHGGPDDEGMFTEEDKNLVLGHRRLSLLDLTMAGHQPMHYHDRYTITYNGELYNFKELKNVLIEFGMQFFTNSDTEVILAAFAKWNTDAFAKFNGMFAFALWDNKEKSLYLVRDAAGIKPLYYSTASDGLAFASEIRALSTLSFLHKINADAPVYQMAYGFLPEPITTLEDVKPLPKGCFLKYNANTYTCSLQQFSFFTFSSLINSEVEAKKKVYFDFNNAVKTQMVADAPIGVFLSGGIDSSIIAKLAHTHVQNDLHTLSIYFDESKYSEKKYQDLIAKDLNSTHHSILLKESDFHSHFPQILDSMDMPSCDGINTWFISKFAADEGIKAVLSGIGADELFGGYPSFSRINKALRLQQFPNVGLSLAAKIANKKYERISYLKIAGIRGIYLFLRGHFSPNEIAKQLGGYEKEVWDILNNSPASPEIICSKKNTASWMEFNLYMQDQLLRDADVMSMAHGLEIRVPFLDNELVKTTFSVNEQIKFEGKVSKGLLINSFNSILPKEIWDRPKMGFSFPFTEWFRNSELVNNLGESGNSNTVKIYKEFLDSKIHWSRIMSLIVMKHKIPASNI